MVLMLGDDPLQHHLARDMQIHEVRTLPLLPITSVAHRHLHRHVVQFPGGGAYLTRISCGGEERLQDHVNIKSTGMRQSERRNTICNNVEIG